MKVEDIKSMYGSKNEFIDLLKRNKKINNEDITDAFSMLILNPLELIENAFFVRETNMSYIKKSLNFCIENRITFRTTKNSNSKMIKDSIKFKCPTCGEMLDAVPGAGSDESRKYQYFCNKCKIEAIVTIPSIESIQLNFK